MNIGNSFGVPSRVWNEWTPEARDDFERLYSFFITHEHDIVIGGYEPVARFMAGLAAEAISKKRLMLGEFYFGPSGYRATQLRRDTRKEQSKKSSSAGKRTGAAQSAASQRRRTDNRIGRRQTGASASKPATTRNNKSKHRANKKN